MNASHSIRSFLALAAVFYGLPLAGVQGENVELDAHRQTMERLVQNYCLDCHSATDPKAGLDLENLSLRDLMPPSHREGRSLSDGKGVARHDLENSNASHHDRIDTSDWEKVVKRLRAGQMPPMDAERPAVEEYAGALHALESVLDRAAEANPQPGHTDAVRRLNRTEYGNAIRDLLAIDIDVDNLLPSDPSGHGFDNVTVGGLSPALLGRYITAAEQISRTAIGRGQRGPGGLTVRLPADRTQETHVEGLPLGTRGGTLIEHHFAVAGEYEIQLRLMRDRDENIEGLNGSHDIDVLLDRHRVHRFTVKQPEKVGEWARDDTLVDANLKKRFRVAAGSHQVGVTFPRKTSSLSEIHRQPFIPSFNRHRHPRRSPALFEVSIVGPFELESNSDPSDVSRLNSVADTPSRRQILTCVPQQPDDAIEAHSCATKNFRRLVRLAYRRPVTDEDLQVPLQFFEQGFANDGFEAGMDAGLAAVLVNPHFLLRAETAPRQTPAGTPYAVPDRELASRLSFFLWSSIPDDTLLKLAESGRLHEPEVLRAQVLRMLSDPRSQSLVNNFAAQWLYLRNLASFQPDRRKFPDFDDNLRHAMRRETELFVGQVIAKDRSVLELIQSETIYLNERLAQHYGVPHIRGSHFRPVTVDSEDHRGGLLRQASILSVTSYATRTSPTVRGNWILENILGIPAPPPPPNIPSLPDRTAAADVTIRERLAEHRANPTCASCHDLMDPLGFVLENYDAVGQWRTFDQDQPIDATGTLPDGREIAGIEALEKGILERPEMFVGTLTEKLLTFALGRGIEATDAPAIRKIVRDASEADFCFSALVQGIATSTPFLMRVSEWE